MDTINFNDIRPYNDEELRQALPRIEHWELIPQILRFIYPQERAEDSLQRLRQVQSVEQLQTTFMYDAICRVVETTSTGFSCSGFDYIKRGRPYLYLSNHRDITLDAFLLQMEFIRRGRETSYIVFGNNLIESPLFRDLFLSNKLIQMERGGNPMAFYRSLQHLSQYLHHLISDCGKSVWIAQKNGRSKDGIDTTAPAIIKMLTLGSDSPQQQTLADLHIVPLAVSYEWDPCDIMKTNELFTRAHGGYQKSEGEDTNSVVTGIIGPKGKIHLSIGKPLAPSELQPEEGTDLADHVAALLDRRIQKLYHLMSTNYLAFDLLNNSTRFQQHYDSNVKNLFLQRMNRLASDEHRRIFMEMYANPVLSGLRK
ncbi:MAG: 1-acyl-sn-glycerol-3-phosphate acyltransferase [Bacteroidales bacterium]|nr:1-acyl-sn-glycerol-3-phosphate acyltransferase [Bacteroidales bacterium]